MVAEQVDHRARLARGLAAHTACVAPLQREVLPHEQAELVGRVVQLRTRDVRVHAHEVEVRFLREHEVAPDLVDRRVGERHATSARGSRP